MTVRIDWKAAAIAQTRACLACTLNDETGEEPCEDCVLDAHAVVDAALAKLGDLYTVDELRRAAADLHLSGYLQQVLHEAVKVERGTS
ncbi:hypothetical protein LCGC14_2113280 [marine sediment metagenome]|uniref:Uncharacterized protein n=1 Tax=marine sediment metagenome TaxID=412755 RepID=A0A0F9GJK8_9ZZZZ